MTKLAIAGPALWTGLALWLAACGSPAPHAQLPAGGELRAVIIEDVRIGAGGAPVVTLMEKGGQLRRLPISIGQDQAESIHIALSEIRLPRPNTHDLLVGMLGRLEQKIERVAVIDLRESTYYAVIDLAGRNGPLQIDARPSDAIALAVRVGAAIFVEERLFSSGETGGEGEAGVDIDWRSDGSAQSRSWLGL